MIDHEIEGLCAFPETPEAKATKIELTEEIHFELKHRLIPKADYDKIVGIIPSCAANVLEQLVLKTVQGYLLKNSLDYYVEKISRQCSQILDQIERLKGEKS